MSGHTLRQNPSSNNPPAGGPPVSIDRKVAHVRAASQVRNHHCHWPGCGKQVPPARWGCLPHWRALPIHLQRQVWAAYRPHQETDGRPSREYIAVARAVQTWIADQNLSIVPPQITGDGNENTQGSLFD